MNSPSAAPWTREQLCHTLRTGEPLPGDSEFITSEEPYSWDYRRRMLALTCLIQYFSSCRDTIELLREIVLNGDEGDIRLECLRELEALVSIDELIESLLHDSKPCLRIYAIEYLLANFPADFEELKPMLQADPDIRVHEILYCIRQGKPLPVFYYRARDSS